MFDRVVVISTAIFITVSILVFALTPIVYDTLHMYDTLFLAELGWRVHLGAVPVLDFNHFYGGITAHYIGLAFNFFGTEIKSLDYATLLQFLTLLLLTCVVCYRRTSSLTFWMLLLLVASLSLTRVPLEVIKIFSNMGSISAHSFSYNRFATSLALLIVVFALIPTPDRRIDYLAGLMSAFASFAIVMSKPTFITFVPALILTLALQRRWKVLFVFSVGLIGAATIFDPGAQKLFGSFKYAIVTAGPDASVREMILKVNSLIWLQWFTAIPTLFMLILAMRSGDAMFRRISLSGIILMGGCFGMTATMGWPSAIGQQAIPFLAVFSLSFSEYARNNKYISLRIRRIFTVSALIIIASFSLPHLVNNIVLASMEKKQQNFALIDEGPLKSYIAWSSNFHTEDGRPINNPVPLERQIALSYEDLINGEPLNVGNEYPVLADGIQALGKIENISELGIVSDTRLGFSYAMEAPPVLDFPVWVNVRSPELADGVPLSKKIDLLLFLKPNRSILSEILERKRGDDFSLCLSTLLWDIYARNQSNVIGCTEQ